MLKNYLKVAFRNIRFNKRYAFINIIGLAIGMTVFFLISLWVLDELSFDRYHIHASRIYRVCTEVNAGSQMRLTLTMPPLKEALLKDFPEVQQVVQISFPARTQVKIKNRTFQEDLVGYADKDLFSVFTFNLLSGDQKAALEAPNTVVITKSMSKKYFGEEDPIGKMLQIGGNSEYTVTGIVEDVPANSHFRFNMLMSYTTLYSQNQAAMEYWMNIQYYTYVLLAERANPQTLEKKFPSFVDSHMSAVLKMMGGTVKFFLQPLTRIHLYSRLLGEISANGSKTYVILFSGIAFLILTLACINFINLATARSAARAREVGLRKTLGAQKIKLVFQFLEESIFFSLVSLIIAVLLWLLINPLFQSLIGRELSYHILKDIWILPGFLGLALLTGLVAGSYPAFYLSSFRPIRVLKNSLPAVHTKDRLRKVLVILQFSVTIFLMIGTITIYQQIHFMKNRNLGLDKENVVVIPNMRQLVRQRSLETIREEFLQLPGIINVAGCFLMPSRSVGKGIYYPDRFSENQPQTTNRMSI